MTDFVLGYRSEDGSVELHHRSGVSWFDAPLPKRRHTCRPQTFGYTGWFDLVERCACGAIRLGGRDHGWREKNARRKS
jgi:hypothetical protein